MLYLILASFIFILILLLIRDKKPHLRFYQIMNNTYLKEVLMLVLKDNQKVALFIVPTSAAGNPALVEGVPVWTISDSAVLICTPSEDGMSAEVKAAGLVGTAQVSVTADADLGEGVRTITGVLDVEVKAGEAVTLTVSHGEPTDQ